MYWAVADQNRGKAIAIRLAEDGFDVCINDIAANKAGIDEVSACLLPFPSPYAAHSTPPRIKTFS